MLRKRQYRVCLATWFCLAAALYGPIDRVAATQLGDLSGSWQLLVDDYLIDEKTDVGRSYHAFEKNAANPVLEGDQPWESDFVYMYGTVLPGEDGNGYRAWYHGYQRSAGSYRNMYATSDDGITWEKPNLGIVDYNGSTDNNMFIQRSSLDHLPQVIHTPWEQDPNQQYKLVCYDYAMDGFRGATSADGIHWTDVPDNPILPNAGDVGNFVWDSHTGQYMGTPKIAAYERGFTRRSVGVSFTDDFNNWPAGQLVLVPDEIDDYWVTEGTGQHTDFYGLSAFAYESGYIGFLWVFQITDGGNDGPIYPELVSSRDGVHWTRQEPSGDHRAPMLELGPSGSWDDGMIFTPNHPLVEGDTIKLFYGGINDTHGYPSGNASAAIGLATLRKDGFASLDAGAETGSVTTKALENMNGTLLVNADASGGWLKVEVLDAEGQVIPGYSADDCTAVADDGTNLAVAWGGQTALPASEEPLRLRFVMNNTSLYSFMAGEGVDLTEVPVVGAIDRPGVLMTFEGDTDLVVTDKLVGDGAQNPAPFGEIAVVDDPAQAAFGDRFASFPPDPNSATLLEMPETKNLGKAFTLAAMVDETSEDFSRFFSSYNGGTPTEAELVFDADPSGTQPGVEGLRAWIQGTKILREVQFDDGQYHHVALTYNDGKARLYLDGLQLGEAADVPGGDVMLTYNLRFGEDHGPTPQTNEPFEGRADDILVYRQCLTPSQMLALAQNGAETFFSGPHGMKYTAEGDTTAAADRFDADGAQDGVFQGNVLLDHDAARARVGTSSFDFTEATIPSTIEFADSSYLGDAFTLAAFIDVDDGETQRLFSAYDGSGSVDADELLFDINPEGSSFNGLRAILGGVSITPEYMPAFTTEKYHHVAMTFDDGLVTLFFNGEEVASGEIGLDTITLAGNLLFGEDWGGTVNEQFSGHADEILFAREALALEDIFLLAHPEHDPLEGDLDGDGFVGGDDLDLVRAHWGEEVEAGNLLMGDASGDGFVGGDDLDVIRAHWGEGTRTVHAVPEPSAWRLLAIGAALSMVRKRFCR